MRKNIILKFLVVFLILIGVTSCIENKDQKYNINYVSLYGDLTNVVEYYDGTSDVELPVLYDSKLKFVGWYDNSEYNGEVISKIAKGETGDKTFYAKWDTVYVPPGGCFPPNRFNFNGNGMIFGIKVNSLKMSDPFNADYIGENKNLKQAHQRDIESAYNVKIQYFEWESDATWGYERIEKIKEDFASGKMEENNIYAMEISSLWIPMLAEASCIVELYNIETEKGYFDDSAYIQDDIINEVVSVGKKVYGYNSGVARPDNFIFYNATKLSSMNIDDPAELWFKGEWTWSDFDSWVKEAQTKLSDGEFTIDASYADFLIGSSAAQGNRLVYAAKNVPMFSKTSITSVIEKMQNYYQNGYWNKHRELEFVSTDFIEGKSLLHNGSFNLLGQPQYYDQFTSLNFELGVVPYPVDDNTNVTPYTEPYTYEDTQGNIIEVSEPLKGRNNEVLTTDDGKSIYGINLNESNFFVSYNDLNCYSILNYSGDRLNGINGLIAFDILYQLDYNFNFNQVEESITIDERYCLSLNDIIPNQLDKNVVSSVQGIVYFDSIKSWSCFTTSGQYDHENSFWYVIKELVVNNPEDFEVLKELSDIYLDKNCPLE